MSSFVINPYRYATGGGGSGTPDSFSGLTIWLNFTDTANLFQDTAGTSPVTTDGQNIKRATNDAGGTAFTESLNCPIYKANIVNGKSVGRFTRVGQNILLTGAAASNYIANNAFTLMLVCKLSGISVNSGSTYNNAHLFGDRQGNFWGLYAAATPDRVMIYNWDGNDDHADNNEAQGSFIVIQARHNGGNIQIRVNDDAWATSASGNTQNVTLNTALSVDGVAGVMDCVHAVAYNVSLSDSDADSLRDWAKDEIGI